MKKQMNPEVMKTNKMKPRRTDRPLIRAAAEAPAQVEPEDFARFEGEGGREVPGSNLVDVPLDNAIWRRPRWAIYQVNLNKITL
jgi:hypothetical protein